MTTNEKPIGYWIKHCHDLLSHYIDSQQAGNGIDRLDWQILNVINQSVTDECQIYEELEPFASSDTISARIVQLQERGLIDGRHKITDNGYESFQKFAAVQDKIRNVVSSGITQEEYETTINVLSRISENLKRARG